MSLQDLSVLLNTELDGTSPQTSWPLTTGLGWTGVTPSSFEQYFNRLPAELQLHVWSYMHTTEPRVIELEPNPRCDQIISYTKTPGYLQACRASRIEGLKVYALLRPEPQNPYRYSHESKKWISSTEKPRLGRILINFDLDTVFLKAELFSHRNAVDLVSKGLQIDHEKIRYLGIHAWGLARPELHREQRTGSLNKDIRKCSSLQKIYMICDEHPRARTARTQSRGEGPWPLYLQDVLVAGQHCVELPVPIDQTIDSQSLINLLGQIGDNQIEKYEFSDECFARKYPASLGFDYINDSYEQTYRYFNLQFGPFPDDDSTWDHRRLIPHKEEDEAENTEGTIDTFNIRACLARLENARMIVFNAKKVIAQIRETAVTKATVPIEGRQGSNPPTDQSGKEMDEARSTLLAGRDAIEKEKRWLFHSWRQARLHMLRCSRIESNQQEFEQILRRKDFVSRYIHHRIQYRQRSSSRGPRPKKDAAEPNAIEMRHLQYAPNVREFVEKAFLQAHDFQERKNLESDGAKAKRQIMSRRGLCRPFGSRENYIGGDDKKVNVYARKSKTEAPKFRTSRLTGPIIPRKPRCTQVDDAEHGIPDCQRLARGYMQQGLKEKFVFRPAREKIVEEILKHW